MNTFNCCIACHYSFTTLGEVIKKLINVKLFSSNTNFREQEKSLSVSVSVSVILKKSFEMMYCV